MEYTPEMYPRIRRYQLAALELLAAFEDIATQPEWRDHFQLNDWVMLREVVIQAGYCHPSVALDAVAGVFELMFEWSEYRPIMRSHYPELAGLVERLNTVIRAVAALERSLQ